MVPLGANAAGFAGRRSRACDSALLKEACSGTDPVRVGEYARWARSAATTAERSVRSGSSSSRASASNCMWPYLRLATASA